MPMQRISSIILALTACGGSKPAVPSDVVEVPVARDPSTVPGLEAIVIETNPDATHCTGNALTVKRVAGKAIPPDDEKLVGFLERAFPAEFHLKGDPDPKLRYNEEIATITAWAHDATELATAALKHYQELAGDDDAMVKVVAVARRVQLRRYLTAMWDHVPIPIDTEAHATAARLAYCRAAHRIADSFKPSVEKDQQRCRELSKHFAGWWNAVCE